MVQGSKLSKIKVVQCDETGNVARGGTSVTFQFNPEELGFSLRNEASDKSDSGGGVVPGPPSNQAFVAKNRDRITTRFDTRLEASHGSLSDNTTGSDNTAVGHDALANNTTANENVAVGANALEANTTGTQNVGVGNGIYGGIDPVRHLDNAPRLHFLKLNRIRS